MPLQSRGDDMTFELFFYSFIAIVCFMAYFTYGWIGEMTEDYKVDKPYILTSVRKM